MSLTNYLSRCAKSVINSVDWRYPSSRSKSQRYFAAKKKNKTSEDEDFDLTLRALRGVMPENVKPFTAEELEQHRIIGQRYNRMTTIEHNHWQRDLQTKIDMKWQAINALPKELQAEALVQDHDPLPRGASVPSWTPPVKGFKLKDTEIEVDFDD